MTAAATPDNVPPDSPDDWLRPLAAAILEDRIDRGIGPAEAGRRAARYRAWLDELPERHDRATCDEEESIRKWPGDLCLHTGQASVFVGRQGAGKTNALGYLIQKRIEHRPEQDHFTNIPFAWDIDPRIPRPPRLYPVRNMSGLLRGIANTVLADRIPAILIDEMDQAFTSHEWASERSESWTKFLFVERHFRVRGPGLAYHVYEHVPLPLRRVGDLRGSYFRVVIRGGERRLARVEDTSAWWGIRESVLPFLTLGLRGFDLDVHMGDLETHLDGDRKQVARQMLAYLDDFAARHEEVPLEVVEAREMRVAALTAANEAVAEQHRARLERREEIVRAFMEDPKLSLSAGQERFQASRKYLVELRQIARKRLASDSKPTDPLVPSSQEPA